MHVRIAVAAADRSAEERRASLAVAPWPLGRLRDADAGPDGDLDVLPPHRARTAVGRAGARRARRLRPSACVRRPGPAARSLGSVVPSTGGHRLEPVRRLERADEDGARIFADEVQAPVDAVRAVDVRPAGRAEHRGVSRRLPAVAVSGRVLVVVGLDLDDPAADAVDEQCRADELRRHVVHAAGEEPRRSFTRRLAGSRSGGEPGPRRRRASSRRCTRARRRRPRSAGS